MRMLTAASWRVFASVLFVLPLLLLIAMPDVTVYAADERRYTDMGNGTVKDEHLVRFWAKNDSFRELKTWLNLKGAEAYVNEKNKERLGGYSDWRLPLKGELKSLYDRKIKGRSTYDVSDTFHVDEVFNISYCYFWTKESINSEFAWQVSLCNGKVYKSGKKNGPGNSVLLIRP